MAPPGNRSYGRLQRTGGRPRGHDLSPRSWPVGESSRDQISRRFRPGVCRGRGAARLRGIDDAAVTRVPPAEPVSAQPAPAPWQELFQRSPLGVVVYDRQGRVVHVNASFAGLLGYSLAEAQTLSAEDIIHPDDRVERDELAARLARGELDEAVADRRLLDRDGRSIQVRAYKSAVTAGDQRLIMVCVTDVGPWQVRVDQLSYAASHDQLTGVLNRSGLLTAVAELTDGGRAARLAVLDLDGLKAINDRYGHAAGDQTLRATAASLQDAGAGDWLVGRLGGDEFAVLSPHVDVELRARIETALDRRITVTPGISFAVSASVGEIVLHPGDDVIAALSAADEQMYLHKRDGAPRPAGVPRQGTADRRRFRRPEPA